MGKSKIRKVMCLGSLHGCMYTKLRNRGIYRKKWAGRSLLPYMSESLSNSFSNLKVIHSRLCWLVWQLMFRRKVTARPKIQIALPNPTTDGRVCFYGYYDVGMEWLVEYGTAHWCRGPPHNRYDDLSRASGAMKLLRKHSGIKRLRFEAALIDHTVPADAVTIPGKRLGESRVPLYQFSVTRAHHIGSGQARSR